MTATKASRIYASKIYARRVIRWRRNSSPFLSGDFFADLSDLSYNGPKWRKDRFSLEKLNNAKIIFCPSQNLQEFLDEHCSKISAKILIAGNDDTEFHTPLRNLPNSIKHVYLQNSFISDNLRIFTLPIGIENFRYGLNGDPRFMTPTKNQSKRDKILFGPFSPTHPDRIKVMDIFAKEQGPWEVLFERLSVKQYRDTVSNFKLVAAVRGNGIDTHRAWEALYRGNIPVVQKNNWSDSLNYLSLPFLTIYDWSPKGMLDLIKNNSLLEFDPNKLESLWASWWIKRFKKIIG